MTCTSRDAFVRAHVLRAVREARRAAPGGWMDFALLLDLVDRAEMEAEAAWEAAARERARLRREAGQAQAAPVALLSWLLAKPIPARGPWRGRRKRREEVRERG